jgi:hypothetical protein
MWKASLWSIYRDERDGAPLSQEVQNVSVDSKGRYNVLLGSTVNEGLPLELFKSGEPRWLGCGLIGQEEYWRIATLSNSR